MYNRKQVEDLINSTGLHNLVLPQSPQLGPENNNVTGKNSCNTGGSGSNSVPPIQPDERTTPEYLQQLLKDKKQIQAFPNVFQHMERLLDEEIFKVRLQLFHIFLANMIEQVELPTATGPVVTLSDKVYVPVKEYPDFNFVGRLLGPRGTTAKFLEHVLNCKIMVRGRGSMRDKAKEEQQRGKQHWEHLSDELHVLLTVEDTHERAEILLRRAVKGIKKFLEVIPEGDDLWKKMQLMELATYNGTFRFDRPHLLAPNTSAALGSLNPIMMHPNEKPPRIIPPPQFAVPQMRSPTPAGAPIILAPRMPSIPTSTAASLVNGIPTMPQNLTNMMSPTEGAMLYGSPYDYPYTLTQMFEYPHGATLDQSTAGRPCHLMINPFLNGPHGSNPQSNRQTAQVSDSS
ncbi:protein quaking-B-like isoform X2 [Tubulanus polymorphus]|uniref:protein quaking-B-like isoform X2 n=1 Tax=Tubulanus polymorphus TaxID=672921 RepID=UPI003DA64C37